MAEQQGIEVSSGVVLPEWIDINRHMNVAYYVLALDRGVDDLWSQLGITNEYIESGQGSTFAVECHVTYQRELKEGDPYVVRSQILAYDAKRIHQFQWLYHARDGFLSATGEWMNLHVDLATRRVSPWPANILDNFAAFVKSQRDRQPPKEAGQTMRVAKPLYAMYRGNSG
ncbi:MAG: thioesterase family protein [Gammaproteobacteria bacterium]|nr:thioesterase family protein [Gammaproteobacteria bacterium]MDH4315533.1 thioesterase family protein [Gammaproteobacteria bacterium]MDH5215514.1 thioesterase family protein [Gammaproteobacteria bacterium]